MGKAKFRLWCVAAIAGISNCISYASPITLGTDIPVLCDTVECGKMKFTTYQTYEDPEQGPPDPLPPFGGVEIEGKFTASKPGIYHYIQSVNRTTSPFKWSGDGAAVATPFIDTPPGGYQGDPFDYKVYYDETEFPQFYDKPGGSVGLLKNLKAAGKKFEMDFESWLVCVILEQFGSNPLQAKDDTYKVAPLLGWTWGFTAEYVDNGDAVDDEKDIVTTKLGLQTIAAVSADFTSALGRTYGTAPNTDKFNVELGDCKNCLPEPSSYLLVGIGMLSLGLIRRRSAPRSGFRISRSTGYAKQEHVAEIGR